MMKKSILTVIFISILASIMPQSSLGLVVPPDIGSGTQVPTPGDSISCIGIYTKLLCVIKKAADVIKSIQKITTVLDYLPHQFPFGGPILSSERACSIKAWVWVSTPLSFGVPVPCPNCLYVPLGGRAIVVGPPVPTYPEPAIPFTFSGSQVPPGGRVIAFPWISKIYDHHTERRAGPWALGLGFSPFPLVEINDGLGQVVITVPPTFAPTCAANFGTGVCIDHIHFDCLSSGETDPFGNDIYKVIRLLGTSDTNAPASAFPPGFTLP